MENSLLMGIFNSFLYVYQRVNQPSLPNWEVSDSYLPHHGDASRGLECSRETKAMADDEQSLGFELWSPVELHVRDLLIKHWEILRIEPGNILKKIEKWDLDMGEVWWSCWAQQNHQENGDQILLESLGWMEFPKGPTPKDSNGWSRMYKDVQRMNGNNGNSIEATADVGLYIDMIWLDMIRGYVLSLSPVYVFRSWNWAWPN